MIENCRNLLGDLIDPGKHTEPISIHGENPELLLAELRTMLVIRSAEEKVADMVAKDIARCPCHLGIGEEAVAVGVSRHLRPTDRVFGAHRSHSHYLALGGDLQGLLSEVLGKEMGCSKGMGGSMHLYGASHGFLGSVPIVAATISMAVGAALAAKKDGRGDVGVSYFGDGASEEGTLHESLNFAATFGLPVLFVCENNFFSSHLHIALRQPANSIARYAEAHEIPHEVVDGNDIVAVARAAKKFVERARKGGGPGFLETVTYRWRGHVGHREDIDVGVKRKDDLALWKLRDPIRRLMGALIKTNVLDQKGFDRMKTEVDLQVERECQRAIAGPYPPPSATLEMVYARE